MARTLVGIDIGSYSIKIVEVLKKHNRTQLVSCGIKTIAAKAPFEDRLTDIQQLYANTCLKFRE